MAGNKGKALHELQARSWRKSAFKRVSPRCIVYDAKVKLKMCLIFVLSCAVYQPNRQFAKQAVMP